jgi:DNA-binding beta-propeller fold protein YncE
VVSVGIAALAALAGLLVSTAAAADRVYWANAGGSPASKISFANLDGSGGGELGTGGAPPACCPFGTAIDAAAGRIYWGSDDVNGVSFANLDGSGGGGDLNSTGATPGDALGVAIDPAGGRIYWASGGGANKISYARLDGSGGGDLSTSGATVNGPRGVAIDPVGAKIYWTNNNGKISFANLDGSVGGDLDTTGATPGSGLTGVAIDPVAGRIYWANDGANKISSTKLDGTGGGADLNTSGATVATPFGVAIDPIAGLIYWANYNSDKISFAKLDGSGGGDLNTTGAGPAAPNFPVLLHTPRGAGDPAISGGSAPGSELACSQGSWAPDLLGSFLYRAPQTFAYQWSVDGADIAGATASSHSASVPGEYRCRVTASNQAGSSSQTSAPHAVAAPPATADLTEYTIEPRSFFAATRGPSARTAGRARPGAAVSFRLNLAASVAFKVIRRTAGRRDARGRCVKRTRRNRNRRTCSRLVTLRGGFTRPGVAGANSFRFTGRLRGRTLRPGRYRLVATPGPESNPGVARRAGFRIKRPRGR